MAASDDLAAAHTAMVRNAIAYRDNLNATRKAQPMTDNETAGDDGDTRTDAQWIGDVAHRTLERLEELRPELANLARQFELLTGWCDTQGMASAAHMLRQYHGDACLLAAPTGAAMLVRSVADATGRPKQPYHKHS